MGPLFQRPASARRPLATAVAALASGGHGGRRAGPYASGRRGGELLPELLGLDGAVQMARALDAPPPSPSDAPSVRDALAHARRGLSEAERDARRPLGDPAGGAPLVSIARLERALDRAGAPATRQRRALAAAARELFTPVEGRVAQRIGTVRRLVRTVREGLAPTVAATGPIGARLEALDAALGAATGARADALVDRAIGAAGDAFAADLEAAVIALPRPCDAMPLAAWVAPGGFVHDLAVRCEGLILATFLHERSRVDMLVASTLGEPL